MKKFLKLNKINILEIVLILSPIIDILTSMSQRILRVDISLGLIIRSFLLLFMISYTVLKSKYKHKKISIIYLITIAIYAILFLSNIYICKGSKYIIAETKELVKAFYFPICLVTILNYTETKGYKIDLKLLFCVIVEYIILLFIPSICHLGYESYAEDKIGTIGWFFSANEISSIYSILIVLIVFSYKYIKNIWCYFILVLISFYTVMQIGTKMPAISTIIAIIAFILFNIVKYMKNRRKDTISSIFVGFGMILLFLIVFVTSPVMKNFDIYKNYLISTREHQDVIESNAISIESNEESDETKAEEIIAHNEQIVQSEINEEKVVAENNIEKDSIKTIEESENQLEEETKELTSDEIATIIHSGRVETLSKINSIYLKSNIITKIIGLGRIDIDNNDEYLIEIDYFDILYNFGILGFIIYFSSVIIVSVMILKNVVINKIGKVFENDYNFCYIIIITNGIICAIAGHTLVAPAVSIYIVLVLVQFFSEQEKKEFI